MWEQAPTPRFPRVRVNGQQGEVEDFPLSVIDLMAMKEAAEEQSLAVPGTVDQLIDLSPSTIMHWGIADNREVLTWAYGLALKPNQVVYVRVEGLPGGTSIDYEIHPHPLRERLSDWLQAKFKEHWDV